MREIADVLVDGPTDAPREAAVALLVEAADFEANRREDLFAAQRHLACALRLSPHDPTAEDSYRDIGRRIVGRAPPSRESRESSDPHVDEAEDAARVEELTRILHAHPMDDRIIDELSDRLLRLGRSHELLALLSARLEDAPPERRSALVPKQREVLSRLEREAREAGRAIEASLFRDTLAMLED
jgi:hypothetical protein